MKLASNCIDRLRAILRAAHLLYTQGRQQMFRSGGPFIDDAGRPRGNLMLRDVPDLAALDEYMRGDPFFGAGLSEPLSTWGTRQAMNEAEPGAMDRELAAARHLAAAPHAVPIPRLKVTSEQAPFPLTACGGRP